jgi:hypothetical protein
MDLDSKATWTTCKGWRRTSLMQEVEPRLTSQALSDNFACSETAQRRTHFKGMTRPRKVSGVCGDPGPVSRVPCGPRIKLLASQRLVGQILVSATK